MTRTGDYKCAPSCRHPARVRFYNPETRPMTTTDRAAHTPGPWLAREMVSGHWQVCQDESSNVVVYAVNEPDARLIAAAPSLLAALEASTAMLLIEADSHELSGDKRRQSYVASLRGQAVSNRAAIALAKGE